MKKLIAMMLSLCLLCGLVACKPGGEKPSDPPGGNTGAGTETQKTFFLSPKMVGAAYWEAAKSGAMQAGEDLGVEVIWNGTSEVDVAKQINMITDMLTRKVDGLGVAPNDATSVTNVFNQAKGAGVPVVTFDSDSENAERAYCILPDTDEAIGEAFLAALINQMPEPNGN